MKTKKKHRKGNLSSDRMLTRAKTMVMNSSDIFSTLSTLREEAFPGLYHDILHFTLSLARHRDVLVASALPRTIVELRSLPAPRPISIEREFKMGKRIPRFVCQIPFEFFDSIDGIRVTTVAK